MSRLHDLGRHVAALQDVEREALHATERAGESFIRAVRRQSRPPRMSRLTSRVLLAATLVGVVAVVVVGWVGIAHLAAPHRLAVSPAVELGDSIRAPRDHDIPLHFSDGSEIRLTSGTEAVVRELTTVGARVDVTRGTAQVAVKHQPDTRWSLHAGPYSVQVTGTRFDLAWSPEDERFSLDLWEGSVRVTADSSDHATVEMVAPERLVIDPKGWHLSGADGEAAVPPPPSATPTASVVRTTPPPSARAASPEPAAPAPQNASWERLASKGDYRAAYDAAQARGLGQITQSGSASQLLALAETCRLSGHGDEGVAVLSRLRARFPNSEEASLAAFQLGRLTGSARWFQTYLDERPNGRLAMEASGRLLEALERSGSHVEARNAARRYLQQYPTGPHAALATRLLSD